MMLDVARDVLFLLPWVITAFLYGFIGECWMCWIHGKGCDELDDG